MVKIFLLLKHPSLLLRHLMRLTSSTKELHAPSNSFRERERELPRERKSNFVLEIN